jgi:hypothetical protein
MSRLDDELRVAFRRSEPSMDFAARVLERINERPAPKKSWWQKLAELFEMPKVRWVAIGVAACLLVAISLAGYRRLNEKPVNDGASVASAIEAPETVSPEAGTGEPDANKTDADKEAVAAKDVVAAPVLRHEDGPRRNIHRRERAARVAINQSRLARIGKEPPVSPEAEAAKERVLFALQIVGSTLSDAQKVIQEDSPKSKPEPLHNR